jgi:bifunctional DNA-binding transcriptional regulator/antitoxin component of YhaV-PrlF toxin-antitoxin module
MKDVKIISIDNRGRIVLPLVTRKNLGITTNSQLMLVSDSETKEIRITPVGISKEDKPIKFRITMSDEPGSLAKIATIFGDLGISLMYGESVIVEKSKTAIWTVIGPTPDHISLEELKDSLEKNGKAVSVEIIPIE